MKKLLLSFILFYWLMNATAQTATRTERVFIHPPLREFFVKHPQLRAIRFQGHPYDSSLQLEVMEDAAPVFAPVNRFNLSTESGRYFFEKRFGPFSFPHSSYRSLLSDAAIDSRFSGEIHKDSIFFLLEQTFPSYEGELVFERTESDADYRKGLHILAAELQRNVPVNAGKQDSVTIFRLLISPKDTVTSVELKDAGKKATPYQQLLMEKLKVSRPWKPYETGGRKLRAYKDLYVRLLPDGSYVIAMN